ncbi:MAG TPA: hypothetical protein VHQ89_03185 [Gaiellaceae bacterium]|jgi:hypothetical protein|nr:hypothetical protein [Gaiellaceae bacterium]
MIDRRSYQLEVERLLSQIDTGMHDLRLLKVSGVRGAALRERKNEVRETRARLASLVSAGPQPQALAA